MQHRLPLPLSTAAVTSSQKTIRLIRHNLPLVNLCWLFAVTLYFIWMEKVYKRIWSIIFPGAEVRLTGMQFLDPYQWKLKQKKRIEDLSLFPVTCQSPWPSFVAAVLIGTFLVAYFPPPKIFYPDFLHDDQTLNLFCPTRYSQRRNTNTETQPYSQFAIGYSESHLRMSRILSAQRAL